MFEFTRFAQDLIKILAIVITSLGSGQSCFSSQEDDELLSRIAINEPVLLIEIDNFRQLFSECQRLKMWTDDRWEKVYELLEDEEQGLLEEKSATQLDEIMTIVERLEIQRVVLVVNSLRPFDFELFVSCDCVNPGKEIDAISKLGRKALRPNDAESGKKLPNELASEVEPSQPDIANWQVVRNWIVAGSTRKSLERGVERLQKSEPVKRAISRSRKNTILNEILRREPNASSDASVYAKFDSRLLMEAGWYNEDWYNALRVDELLGAGLRVGIKNVDGEPAIAMSGFVLTSTPRVGLGSYLRSVAPPEKMPEIPQNTDLLKFSSVDNRKLWEGFESAYQRIYKGDPGKHLIFGPEYENQPKEIHESLKAFAEFQKCIEGHSITGRYRDHTKFGTGTYSFAKLDLNERNLEVVKEMLRTTARFRGFGEFRETDINGHRAFINAREDSSEHYLLWNGWLLKGSLKVIQHYANHEQLGDVRLDDELDREIKEMTSLFVHSDKLLFVRAYWPKYFTSLLSTAVRESIRERHVGKDIEAYQEAMKLEWAGFDLAAPNRPLSNSQTKTFASVLAGQIFRDAIGKVVIVATKEENGFKVSATHFQVVDNVDDSENKNAP